MPDHKSKQKAGESSERRALQTVLTRKKGRRHESTRIRSSKNALGPPPQEPPPPPPTTVIPEGLPSRLNRLSSPPPISQSIFPSSDFDEGHPFEFAELDEEDDVADEPVVLHNLQPFKRVRVSFSQLRKLVEGLTLVI